MTKDNKNALVKLTKRLKAIKARDIMTKKIISVKEDDSLASLAEIMIKNRISGAPVINKSKKVIGIITLTDLFMVMDMIKSGDFVDDQDNIIFNPTVKYAMSTEIIKAKADTTLEEIISIMKFRNVHTLPIFNKNKLIGIIGRRDVFKNFYSIVKNI